MNMMIRGAGSNSGNGGGAGMPAYLRVFTKEKTYQGIGQFRLQEGSRIRGIKETVYIVLDGLNFFPDMTDSIEYLEEFGLKGESGWQFRTHRGKITAYSAMRRILPPIYPSTAALSRSSRIRIWKRPCNPLPSPMPS